MRLIVILAVVLCSCVFGCGDSDSDDVVAVEDFVEVSEDGVVSFVDSNGLEVDVIVQAWYGELLSGIEVEFWDFGEYYVFFSYDPEDIYARSFEFCSKGEFCIFSLVKFDSEWVNQTEEVSFDSSSGQLVDSLFFEDDIKSVYVDSLDVQDIDRLTEDMFVIVNMAGPRKYFKFFQGSSFLRDVLAGMSDIEDWWASYFEVFVISNPAFESENVIYWLEPIYVDRDGDGYPIEFGDCDDFDSEVYPEALEVCDNRVDDNCDGVVDEDCPPCDPADLWVLVNDEGFLLNWDGCGNEDGFKVSVEYTTDFDSDFESEEFVVPAWANYDVPVLVEFFLDWSVCVSAFNELGVSEWVCETNF